MGVFDTLHGKIRCNKCGKIFESSVQVKWSYGWFENIHVGDNIKVDADGEYSYINFEDSEIDETQKQNVERLKDTCPHCGSEVLIKAVVKDGILKNLESVEE